MRWAFVVTRCGIGPSSEKMFEAIDSAEGRYRDVFIVWRMEKARDWPRGCALIPITTNEIEDRYASMHCRCKRPSAHIVDASVQAHTQIRGHGWAWHRHASAHSLTVRECKHVDKWPFGVYE